MLPAMLLPGAGVGTALRSTMLRLVGAHNYLGWRWASCCLLYIIDFGHYAYLGVRLNPLGVHCRCGASRSNWSWELSGLSGSASLADQCGGESNGPLFGWSAPPRQAEAGHLIRAPRISCSVLMVIPVVFLVSSAVYQLIWENRCRCAGAMAFFFWRQSVGGWVLNPVFLYDTLSVRRKRYDLERCVSIILR